MKKRILATLLSALLVAALATSCDSGTSTSSAAGDASEAGTSDAADAGGDSDTSGDVIELEFFQQQGEEAIQAGYEAVIADFEEEYPNNQDHPEHGAGRGEGAHLPHRDGRLPACSHRLADPDAVQGEGQERLL